MAFGLIGETVSIVGIQLHPYLRNIPYGPGISRIGIFRVIHSKLIAVCGYPDISNLIAAGRLLVIGEVQCYLVDSLSVVRRLNRGCR